VTFFYSFPSIVLKSSATVNCAAMRTIARITTAGFMSRDYCRPRIADSSSINAVNFFSARLMKRFPVLRCASAIQIVRPRKSTAETQPKLQPRFLRLSAMISQYFRSHPILMERDWRGAMHGTVAPGAASRSHGVVLLADGLRRVPQLVNGFAIGNRMEFGETVERA
jgi:hypothetical protein